MVDENRCLQISMAGGCILCILTPIVSIIPICIFALREGNRIECAGPGLGIPVIYIIIIALNQKCIFSVFRWLKNLILPHSSENEDDKYVVGQKYTDSKKFFIKALRPYSATGRNEVVLKLEKKKSEPGCSVKK
ncbi:hypothetical protein CHS0354_012402 [Potamilus streckersoni]|uniref:Uncharacterized protein n=1 Tax=Potamilus streckersoni TaxID=2493646 RepID=A0AAE0RYY0_9BIVA|nr:hypothetical protein CHS0354_012402 [Potamilus streckersoni]